ALISAIELIDVLSTCRFGKCSSKSPKVKICNSFFKRSAFNGPTPLRYSIGLSNIDGDGILITFTAKIMGI
ncbi:MAG TPA: hypothetical protein VLJ41_14670, partial [Segetibacter sp.]|nr:hypothetical protein [Segetibacter sp.]